MSATATAWVWKHSPYRNGALNVHAALADTANDLNDNQIWFSVMRLAAKARCGRSTVLATQARMLKDNLLEVVAEQRGPASPTVYRLLFPADAPVVYEDGTSPRTKPVQQSDQSKKGQQLVQLPDSCPITEHKEPNPSRKAHALAVLAMEQPKKPAGKNAFPQKHWPSSMRFSKLDIQPMLSSSPSVLESVSGPLAVWRWHFRNVAAGNSQAATSAPLTPPWPRCRNWQHNDGRRSQTHLGHAGRLLAVTSDDT